MKNITVQNNGENAPDKADSMPGRYVERLHRFEASVLAALLEGEELTARDTGYRTRLSRAVELLEGSYGWRIDTRDSVIEIYDGRPARFKTYSLNAEQVARARGNGADSWCRVVKLVHDIMVEAQQYHGYYGFSKYHPYPAEVHMLMALRKQLLRRKGQP